MCVKSFLTPPSFFRSMSTGGVFFPFRLKNLQCSKQRMGKPICFTSYLVSHEKHKENEEFMSLVNTFAGSRADFQLVFSKDKRLLASNDPVVVHFLKQGDLVADSCVLERLYLGTKLRSNDEIISSWTSILQRRSSFRSSNHTAPSLSYSQLLLPLIQRISYLSKSLQSSLVPSSSSSPSLVKSDTTVVTYLDYAIQAILIDHIHSLFPNDLFLVEEDYHELQTLLSCGTSNSKEFLNQILSFVNTVFSSFDESDGWMKEATWNEEKLLSVFQIASKQRLSSNLTTLENLPTGSEKRRLWIIDPIDGTKGFISGKQYCHALSVVELNVSSSSLSEETSTNKSHDVEGKPLFSCISCPNLNIKKVFLSSNIRSICESSSLSSIVEKSLPSLLTSEESIEGFRNVSSSSLSFPDVNDGLLVYTEEDEGVHCRSFSMPLDSGYPLFFEGENNHGYSSINKSSWIICQPVEKNHHNATMTQEIVEQIERTSSSSAITPSSECDTSSLSELLSKNRIFLLPVYSQVKYVLILLGLADGYLKISSQPHYNEKIYDHFPGYHLCKDFFYNRKGDFLTNLYGNPLIFNYQTGLVENTRPSFSSPLAVSSLVKRGSALNGLLVSSNPKLHALVTSQFLR
jgi:3'-phosphoadenosine 5'-phosphosulfate (PAPS) 3'-phosphatase